MGGEKDSPSQRRRRREKEWEIEEGYLGEKLDLQRGLEREQSRGKRAEGGFRGVRLREMR